MNIKISILSLLVSSIALSQGVAINENGNNPNPNAILDVDAINNDKGIFIPRLSSGQRTGIAGLGAGDEGLTVYDETTNSYWLWDGIQWVQFSMNGNAWNLAGNAGTNPGVDFIGTTDAQDWVIKTNNTERVRILANGNVGIGTTAPNRALTIQSNEPLMFKDAGGADEWHVRLEGTGNGNLGFTESGAADHRFVLEQGGNVGINTDDPTSRLDINGTIRIRGGAPQEGAVLMSTDANGNGIWSNAGYGLVPIGSIIGWHGNIGGGLPALPAGWVECSGGTVSDAASPINGRPIPNLNGGTTSKSGDASRGRFLRGHTASGQFEADESNNLQQYEQDDDDTGPNGVVETIDDDGNWTQYMSDYNSDDRMRFRAAGLETRVTNMSVRWIMRIK